ncbi:MAG: hypothetical protein WCK28_15375, partial [Burkholderiales bacterium]
MIRTEPLLLSRGPAVVTDDRSVASARPRERVGDILIRQGALDAGSASSVAAHQVRTRQLFGEAAVALRLVDAAAVARALAEQAEVSPPADALARLSRELAVAHDPFGREAERLRDLRARLLVGTPPESRRGRGRVI